jgi:hypothetical protein
VEERTDPMSAVTLSDLGSFFNPQDGEKVLLEWKNIDGKLYLVGIASTRVEFHGCPC